MSGYHVVEMTDKEGFEQQCSKWIAYGFKPVGGLVMEVHPLLPFIPAMIYRQAFYKPFTNESP